MSTNGKKQSKAVSAAVSVPKPEFQHSADFLSRYANHIFYEPSAWDMKFVFGEVDQSQSLTGKGPEMVSQHTAISLPWPQLKVLLYFAQLHLLLHEARMGRIHVPPAYIPSPAAFPEEVKKGLPDVEQVWEKVMKHYQAFIQENPEAATPK